MTGAETARAQEIRHPLFARFFDRLSRLMEPELGPHRDRLLAGLSGTILELGAGNGVNFSHYPRSVREVVALEPEPFMRAKAQAAAAHAPVPVRVLPGVASALPFEARRFDAAVASLVLCSVPDLGRAIAELRRVLKHGGELRFLEHVRAAGANKAAIQALLDRSGLFPLLGGGCHCSRRTEAAIAAGGFALLEAEQICLGASWWVTNPHVRGSARGVSAARG